MEGLRYKNFRRLSARKSGKEGKNNVVRTSRTLLGKKRRLAGAGGEVWLG